MLKSVLLSATLLSLSSFALTIDEALKIWENAYNQGYNDAIEENSNIQAVLEPGYYIAVPATNAPKYLLGLLKFNAKKMFPINYVGTVKGKVLLLLYSNNINDARYLKSSFEKRLKPILDRFNLNPYIFELKTAP